MNEHKIDKLTPHTKYEVSVAAGNSNGYSEETTTALSTRQDGKNHG